MRPMAPIKSGAAKKLVAHAPRRGSSKPRIRMRKLKTVAGSAFPRGPAAFPQDGGGGDPNAVGEALDGPPAGAAPGTVGS